MLATAVLLYATSGRYGYHRDELYFRMLPLRWGYVDQPFLTPALAKASIAVFGDTLVGLRVLAPVFLAGGIVLAALIARELGGTPRAQALAAWGYGFALLPLLSGHYLVTGTIDLTLWAAVLLCLTRALLRAPGRRGQTGQPWWWVVTGALVGVAMDNKLLIAILVIGVLVGLLAVGPRDVLVGRWLWLGVLAALVLGAPTLIYQALHGWPQLTMASALHDHNGADVRVQVVPFQVLLLGVPVFPVAVVGYVALWRRPDWRPVRCLAVAYPLAVVINFLAGGQVYYAFGLLAYLLTAGFVATTWSPRLLVALVAVNALVSCYIALPVLPVRDTSVQGALNPTVGDQVGWPTYVATVTRAVDTLTPEQRAHAVIFTGNYGEAGAIARYGRGLPPVYSGQNGLHALGPPPADRTVVVEWTEGSFDFDHCRVLAHQDDGVGVDNEEQGSRVAVCRLPAEGWAALWPSLQHYD
jgi:4-amino-4-deoxy-L-arabinose transferase-like glycosyltransferase